MNGTVLIAGAGLAGARCAENLRSLGFGGRIVLAGGEPHPPYERPALSKEFLSGGRSDLALRAGSFWEEQGIELSTGSQVEAVDTERRSARIGQEHVDWDALVIATGAARAQTAGPPGRASSEDARRRAGARGRAVCPRHAWSSSEPASSAARWRRRRSRSSRP